MLSSIFDLMFHFILVTAASLAVALAGVFPGAAPAQSGSASLSRWRQLKRAYDALIGPPDRRNFGSGPTLAFSIWLYRLILMALFVFLLWATWEWIGLSLAGLNETALILLSLAGVFFILVFTVPFLAGFLGLPTKPTLRQGIAWLACGWLVVNLVAGRILLAVEPEWNLGVVRAQEVVKAVVVGSGLTLLFSIAGGLTWVIIATSTNRGLFLLPKELILRFWLGTAQVAALLGIGFSRGNFEGVVAFASGTLVAGSIGRIAGFLIGIPAGLFIAYLIERYELVHRLTGGFVEPFLQFSALCGALAEAGLLAGMAAAALIGLASSPVRPLEKRSS